MTTFTSEKTTSASSNATAQLEALRQLGFHPEIIRLAWDLGYSSEELARIINQGRSAAQISELLLGEAEAQLGSAESARIRQAAGLAKAAPASTTKAAPASTTRTPSGVAPQGTYATQSRPAVSVPGTAFPWPVGLKRGIFADAMSLALAYVLWRVDAYFLLVTLNVLGLPVIPEGSPALELLHPLSFSPWLAIPLAITIIQRIYWPKPAPKQPAQERELLAQLLNETAGQQGTTVQDRLIWGASFGGNVLTSVVGMALLLFGAQFGAVTVPSFGANLATVLITLILLVVGAGLALGPEWIFGKIAPRLWRRLRLAWLWAGLRAREIAGRRPAPKPRTEKASAK